MTARIDDDELTAYLDGELDEARLREVEAAMAADPAFCAEIETLRTQSATLRAAFNEPMNQPVPDRLATAIDAAFAARGAAQSGPSVLAKTAFYRWPLLGSIAASLLAVVVGLSGAYYFAERQVELKIARLEAIRVTDQRMIEEAVVQALEMHVSGIPAQWANPDSGSRGMVEPVRTFKISSGQWCREYVHKIELHGWQERSEVRRAIACREADGQWQTRMSVTGES